MTLFKDKYRIETTRLKHWDYASAGWYFVTICTRGRECFFGEMQGGTVHLSAIGEVAREYWQAIPQHSPPNIKLDAFVIMPNHMHGIIVIKESETPHDPPSSAVSPHARMSQISPTVGSLGAVVRSYKSAVTRWCNDHRFPAFDWQARFYDHIIRDEAALHKIRQYIADNPAKWEFDKDNPANLWM